MNEHLQGRSLPFRGPYRHFRLGLCVPEETCVELEVAYISEDEITEGELIIKVIAMVWPATTALTYYSPPHINAKEAPFHTKRLEIAGGK